LGRRRHPYTRGLLAAVPRLDRGRSARLQTIEGAPPNLLNPPQGCRFRPRCQFAVDACRETPEQEEPAPGHTVACHRWRELGPLGDSSATAVTAVTGSASANGAKPILKITDVSKFFPLGGGLLRPHREVRAVNGVSLGIKPGETGRLVRESGRGKSTLRPVMLRLRPPTDRPLLFD